MRSLGNFDMIIMWNKKIVSSNKLFVEKKFKERVRNAFMVFFLRIQVCGILILVCEVKWGCWVGMRKLRYMDDLISICGECKRICKSELDNLIWQYIDFIRLSDENPPYITFLAVLIKWVEYYHTQEY